MFRTKASVSFEYKYICNENVTYFILKIWTSGRGEAEGKGVEGGCSPENGTYAKLETLEGPM